MVSPRILDGWPSGGYRQDARRGRRGRRPWHKATRAPGGCARLALRTPTPAEVATERRGCPQSDRHLRDSGLLLLLLCAVAPVWRDEGLHEFMSYEHVNRRLGQDAYSSGVAHFLFFSSSGAGVHPSFFGVALTLPRGLAEWPLTDPAAAPPPERSRGFP